MLLRGATVGSVVGGLVAATDLQITTTSNLGISCSAGECLINGSSVTTQSAYYLRNTAALALSLSSANPSNPRVDLVAASIADSAYTGSSNAGSLAVITGTPTSGANITPGSGGYLSGAPSLPTSSYALAYTLLNAAATSVTGVLNVSAVATLQLGLSDTGWITLPTASTGYQNSWASNGGPATGSVAGLRKSQNVVRFGGSITSGASGSQAFVLAAAYRPTYNLILSASSSSPVGTGVLTIATGGGVIPYFSTGTVFDLDGITYTTN